MKNSSRMTLLVCSCDSYEDLWFPFFKLLKKNWPELNTRIVLNTETKKFNYTGLNIETLNTNMNYKRNTYGERMIKHLERIDTEYIFLMLDDFFLRDSVDETLIDEYIDILDNDSTLATINFDPNNRGGAETSDFRLKELPRVAPYKLNMQAGIWRKEALIKYWSDLDSPWQWEIFGNYQTFDGKDRFYHIKDKQFSPINYGLRKGGWAVYRGKWVKDDVETLFSENDIEIDYDIRGVFDNDSTALFSDKNTLLKYLLRRLKFSQLCSFIFFKLFKKIGFHKKYRTHTDYLSRKNN
ncbi:hypothetical protein PT251_00490 [Erysipelothrix rhusiopathiae]|uniref:Glycosyltransferase n=1 Tax=Erysipelothrix rhusiopathiae TaxID=1648 RepID=A0A6S6I2F2_ERYRH|nr:hypothetical protein [Erysipelothrix rhusiopathiae]BCB22717.1 hypothetical protein [Erysipelothrix rhusiopathiae]